MAKLTFPTVTVEAQRDLLAAVLEFRALEPWAFMGDRETLGWEDPVTGRLRMAVVLGTGGTMFGVAVYRGELGLHFLLKTVLHEDEGEFNIRDGAEMDVVRIELTRKSDLRREEIAQLKVLGFKPEKGISPPWPRCRSFLPGMTEWLLDQAETEMLTADVRRVTAFARLVQSAPDLFADQPVNAFPFWPRHKPVTEPLTAGELEWHQLTVPPRPVPPPFSLSVAKLAQLRALPQQPRAVWEAGSAYSLDSIMEPPRPFYVRIGLAVDRETGCVLGMHLGNGGLTLEHTAATAVVDGMTKIGFRPKVVHLVDEAMRLAFQPVADELGIQTTAGQELYGLLEAMQSLMQSMDRHGQ